MPRSRNGCTTCKKRHRKCDETKPSCQECKKKKLKCEGYDLKLQWDVGIASRGKLTGASLPVLGSGTKMTEQERLAVDDASRLSDQSQVAPLGVGNDLSNGDLPSDILASPFGMEYSVSNEIQEPEWLQRRSHQEKALFEQCKYLPSP
jgi:hypothetical protein